MQRGFAEPITPSYHDVLRALSLLTGRPEEEIDEELREVIARMYRRNRLSEEMGLVREYIEAEEGDRMIVLQRLAEED